MRYRIRLINTETGKSMLSSWSFTNRKKADEYAQRWNDLGEPFKAEVIDTRRK